MRSLDWPSVKRAFTTRVVPPAEMAGLTSMDRTPRIGDLAAAEVLELGRNLKIETRAGVMLDIFPGDVIVGSFGARYATDQFEGYVPAGPVEEFDLLSVGGVCGEIASQHAALKSPTRLRGLGFVCDREGEPINQRDFGLGAVERVGGSGAETILVVGSSMNSGKTTTAGTIARALTREGRRVAAAKVTGTAAGKDARFFEACGASPVLDFTDAGYPSTYTLGLNDLVGIQHTLISHLLVSEPDYVVLEIADGIFQRETRMMLDSDKVIGGVDHVIFAAGDSLSAESGVRSLKERGLPLRGISGVVTLSLLASREAEEATGIPCLSTEEIMDGALAEALGIYGKKDRPNRMGRGLAASAAGLPGLPAVDGVAAGRSA